MSLISFKSSYSTVTDKPWAQTSKPPISLRVPSSSSSRWGWRYVSCGFWISCPSSGSRSCINSTHSCQFKFEWSCSHPHLVDESLLCCIVTHGQPFAPPPNFHPKYEANVIKMMMVTMFSDGFFFCILIIVYFYFLQYCIKYLLHTHTLIKFLISGSRINIASLS